MTTSGLYAASVPVLRYYLGRLAHIIDAVPEALWRNKLTEDGFTARDHALSTQDFALRAVFPTMGQTEPRVPETGPGSAGLRARTIAIDTILSEVSPNDLDAAAGRRVVHEAGQGNVEMEAVDFLTRFALPNFFFHLTTAYAILRAGGASLGKVDFDGLHIYAPDFRF